jgi:hypothetical protein
LIYFFTPGAFARGLDHGPDLGAKEGSAFPLAWCRVISIAEPGKDQLIGAGRKYDIQAAGLIYCVIGHNSPEIPGKSAASLKKLHLILVLDNATALSSNYYNVGWAYA